MRTKILNHATTDTRSVVLLELELEPTPNVTRSLYIVVIDLPPDARGRVQHWCRTEHDPGDAAALYSQALDDHIASGTSAAE